MTASGSRYVVKGVEVVILDGERGSGNSDRGTGTRYGVGARALSGITPGSACGQSNSIQNTPLLMSGSSV